MLTHTHVTHCIDFAVTLKHVNQVSGSVINYNNLHIFYSQRLKLHHANCRYSIKIINNDKRTGRGEITVAEIREAAEV